VKTTVRNVITLSLHILSHCNVFSADVKRVMLDLKRALV